MVLPVVKKVVMFVPKKLVAINKNVDKVISLPENADKTFTYITKITGATISAAEVTKENMNLTKALVCQNDIYTIV